MKRPCDQAKLFFLALLRSTAALATESSKLSTSTMSSVKIFPATAAASSASSSAAASAASAATTSRWIQLRLARRTDVPSLQRCNLATLPENYNSQFYLNHLRTWPDLALVCEALPLNYNQDDAPPQNANGNNHKLASLWGGASRPFQAEPNIVAYVLGKIEEDEDYYDDDDEPNNNNNDDEEWIDNDDAYYAAWSKPSLLRFRNANPSHRSLSSSSSSSNSLWSRQEEEDLIQELSSSSRQRGSNNAPASRSQQQQQQQRRPRRHRLRGHVTSLAVLPEYRRLGLAASLMKQLHHHLTTTTSFNLEQPPYSDSEEYGWDTTGVYQNDPEKKITRVGLHVRKSNTAACSLYQRDGYEVTRVISNYYQDGEDAFYMTKALAAAESTSTSSQSRQASNNSNNRNNKGATSNNNNNNKSPPPQQRLWGGGSQRWRVSSPQDRKQQQQQQQQVPRPPEEPRSSSSKTLMEEFDLPRFIDLEVERQEYLRQKEAAAAAAAATATTTTGSKQTVEQHHHLHDHDDEPELLTGTM